MSCLSITLTVKNVKECSYSSLNACIYIEGNNYIFSTLDLIRSFYMMHIYSAHIFCESPCQHCWFAIEHFHKL